MIISTVLRLMRGAAKASLKAGKFAIDTSGKLVKTGARAAKHVNMTPEEKKAAKKNEKCKDKARNTVKKTGGAAVKATGHIISEGFILLVGLIEDFFVLLMIVLLILALILVVCVVTIFGTFSGVMLSDISSTSTRSSSYSFGGSKTAGTAVKITDPTTYDWWGNKDQNMLLLTDNWEKDIYQYVMIGYDLEHFENKNYSESAECKYGYLNGEYIIAFAGFESGLLTGMDNCIYVCKDDEYYEKRRDISTFIFYPVAAGFCTRADNYGEIPLGIGYVYAVDIADMSFSHYKVSDVDKNLMSNRKTLLKNGVCQAQDSVHGYVVGDYIQRDWNDEEVYTLLSLPGGLRFSWETKREQVRGSGLTGEQVAGYLTKFGKEDKQLSRDEICGRLTYCLHHGESWNSIRNSKAPLLLTAMYCYGDEGFDSWWVTDNSGNITKEIISGMTIFSNVEVSKNGVDGYTVHVMHDGKEETYASRGVLDILKDYIKDAGLESDYNTLINRGNSGGTSSAINIWACGNQTLIGNDLVRYLVDRLGIVFDSEDGEEYGGETFSKADTVTQANLKDTMLMHYVKGGVTSNSISEVFLADVEAYKKKNPSIMHVTEYTISTNPWLNQDWCAATVKGLLSEAKLSGSNLSIMEALRKHGSYPTVSNCADLGIGGWGRMSPGSYDSVTTSEGDSRLIRVHYTNKSAIYNAYNGDISNYQRGAEAPQCVNYVSNGHINVVKESLYEPKAGDVIVYSFDNYGWSHVGLCYDYNKGSGIITTVEGNTGANTSSGAYGYTSHSFNYKDNQSLAWIVEIDYVGLEKACGVSSTSGTTDESGVFKVDSFVKNKVKTGLGSLDNKTKKFIDVSVNGTSCKVTTYEKSANDKWDTGPVSLSEGYVGSKGLASAVSNSYEGSNMTPYGTYYCRTGFGNGTKDSLGIKMSTWYNIGDGGTHIWSGSGKSTGFDGGEGIEINKYYNKSINGGTGAENLTSYAGYAYKYAMFIEYNSGKTAKPGGGSAFFLHVGSQPTAGCIAIPESDMLKIAQWADDNTVICIHKSNEVIDRQSEKQNLNNS